MGNGSLLARTFFLFAFMFGFLGTAAAEVPRNGLVAEYHFDGDAKDSSGNGNDGTVYGSTFVDGKFGQALNLNGVSNYVSVPDSPSLAFSGSLTVSFWVKTVSTETDKGLLSKWVYGSGYLFYDVSHKSRFVIGSSAPWIDTKSNINDGVWHNVVGVYNNGAAIVYFDGVKQGEVEKPVITASNLPLEIGRYGQDNRYAFNGAIDEIRIYNRALSDAEVAALYDPSGDMAKQLAQAELDRAKNSALELINSVSARLDMLKRDGVDISLLEQALKNARDSYDAGKYADSYGLAQNAKKMADDAYAAFQVVKAARAEIDGAKAIGAAVPDAETKLNDAMDALNKGDYPRAQSWASEAAQLAKKASVGSVSIKDLKALATKYDQRSVEVSGTIRSIDAVYGSGYKFAVDDGTGMVSVNYGSSLSDIKDGDKVTASGLFQSSTGLILADKVEKAGIMGGVKSTGSSTSILAVISGLVVLGLLFFMRKKKKK